MTSHKDFISEWSALKQDFYSWTIDDLKIVAEIGKALLERNGDLETEISDLKADFDDQSQLNKYLQDQVTSMKEEALKQTIFYEQLETSISELERDNSFLSQKHDVDKKRIKSLCENIDYLEKKCEEITTALQTLHIERNRNFYMEKINRGNISDEMVLDTDSGIGLSRRSKSLQDLRDTSPSPTTDDFFYNHRPENNIFYSNSNFDQSAESPSKSNSSNENLKQLEDKLFYLTQESSLLYENLKENITEKELLIDGLKNQLSDCIDCSQYTENNFNYNKKKSIYNNYEKDVDSSHDSTPSSSSNSNSNGQQSQSISPTPPPPNLCKRCCNEVNLLKLLNTIEDDEYEYEELRSLEDELNTSFIIPETNHRKPKPRYLPEIKLLELNDDSNEMCSSNSNSNSTKSSILGDDYLPEKWYFEEKELQKGEKIYSLFWWLLMITFGVLELIWSILHVFLFLSTSIIFPFGSSHSHMPTKLKIDSRSRSRLK